MDGNGNVLDYIKTRAGEVDRKMEEYLSDRTSVRYLETLLGKSGYQYDADAIDKAIISPAKYLLALGGKRWRPVLMLTVIDALGKDSNQYVEFSIIPEIIHNGTLVHDDIEDRSEVRRGAPTLHIKYGLDIAVNLGDFMYYFPMVALLDSKKIGPAKKIKMLEVYQKEMLRVCLGQATDIAWHNMLVDPLKVTESEYLQTAYSKTGVLANMSAKLGAILGDADDRMIDILGRFGATIGVAFQLQDDLLNVTESDVANNKGGVGEDITEGKITLLTIYTIQKADEQDRKRLVEILGMHTADRALIKEAVSILAKHGAHQYVKNIEEKLVTNAWKEVDAALPESDAKKKLKMLAEYLIDRSI